MKASDIAVMTFLELKPKRREAYGLTNPYVRVERIETRGGYKTPWIYASPCPASRNPVAAFRPSDFTRALGPKEAGQIA